MFAFALWDRQARSLTLARDRLGEKPLYYGNVNGAFVFASELKAFRAVPGFSQPIDKRALSSFFCQGTVPTPWTIYEGVSKLLPGHFLTVRARQGVALEPERIEAYWSLKAVLASNCFRGSPEEAVSELKRLLSRSVRSQMVADVPVGAFLSGGIDSSAVVALMQSSSSRRIQTYSVGFAEPRFNEAPQAAAVAQHLGTWHTELVVTAADAGALIPKLPEIWDEPFADSSQIPTAILAALAGRDVTVSLTGDGGDELFCGYPHYRAAQMVERLPAKPLLRALLPAFQFRPAQTLLKHILGSFAGVKAADRLSVLAEILKFDSTAQRYTAFLTRPSTNLAILKGVPAEIYHPFNSNFSDELDCLKTVSAVDALSYLPDDILTKVDRAGMAVSLETRIPLLDHRVVEFAFSLPSSYKVRKGKSKWPLRQLLNEYVPARLVDRPKMGFAVPVEEWLRGPLRTWAGDLLFANQTCSEQFLDCCAVQRLWDEHQSSKRNQSAILWRVLMFQAWQHRYA
jgi:asparagine synthase (glutamine-hydrolysing)